ncbi:MAG: transketolase [Clostridiales bacterium]|jgi:transketolase|nr:transketolase [Clostridiales bacterium]
MELHILAEIAAQRRLDVLEMVYASKAGHIGGSLSCMDILVALFHQVMAPGDRFVLSKGHCAEALFAVLSGKGCFPPSELQSFSKLGTKLAGHPTPKVPGVDFATGSLGHGLSVGVGMALGLKLNGTSNRAFVLMGDGEQAEGSVWEAAMAGSKHKLDNLVAVIDRNMLQISGSTESIMPLEDLALKYEAFGFIPKKCDGHDMGQLVEALSTKENRPVAVIASTVKGQGSSVTSNKAQWHHKVPSKAEYEIIKADFALKTKKGGELYEG